MRPRLSDLLATVRVVSIPMRTKFRGLSERELMVFEGPKGFSEWAAFTEYGDEEASLWLDAAIEWAFEDLPDPIRNRVPINAILPAMKPESVQDVLSRAGQFQTVKIKVAEPGQDLAEDLARIREVKSLYPNVKLRLDANGALNMSEALRLIENLAAEKIAIEYFEQPVSTIAELAELRLAIAKAGLEVLVAADESIRRSSDPLAVELADAADILVLKSAPLGGIRKALQIANSSNLKVVASSAMQSSIGLAAELHFAASLHSIEFDAGLGTIQLFAGDLVADPLVPVAGYLEPRRPTLKSSSLDTFRAEDHRFDWWVERLVRCARIIGLES